MARVLIIHSDRSARKRLEHHAETHHQVAAASDLRAGLKLLARTRPQVVVVGLSVKKTEAFEFLRHQQRDGKQIPTIVVASADAGSYQPLAMKLGAAAFLEYPLENTALDEAIAKITNADFQSKGQQPPITAEEAAANLTELEADLNRRMQCFAGKNLVYIQSFVLGGGKTSTPRIALKCPLRKQYGEPPNVYYEYVRDVCCSNPSTCTAHQTFKAKHSA